MTRLHWNRCLAFAAAAFIVAAAAFALWWERPREAVQAWRAGPPAAGWATLERQEEKWRSEGIQRHVEHDYRPLRAISIELQLAVLVSEDIGYFGHGPLDIRAVWQAVDEWWHGSKLRGASTISQQLAKALFLSPERSIARKLDEVRLAWWLEHDLGKARILELYLNVVEFGPGAFGAESAARRYFSAAAADLTPEQAAALAAAIPSPGRDNPTTETRRWTIRRELILERMQRATWLRRQLSALRG